MIKAFTWAMVMLLFLPASALTWLSAQLVVFLGDGVECVRAMSWVTGFFLEGGASEAARNATDAAEIFDTPRPFDRESAEAGMRMKQAQRTAEREAEQLACWLHSLGEAEFERLLSAAPATAWLVTARVSYRRALDAQRRYVELEQRV